MKLETGNPVEPGRYVVWKQCGSRQVRDWCEPAIASWHDGKWAFFEPVICWFGPLPVVHMETGEVAAAPAYDL